MKERTTNGSAAKKKELALTGNYVGSAYQVSTETIACKYRKMLQPSDPFEPYAEENEPFSHHLSILPFYDTNLTEFKFLGRLDTLCGACSGINMAIVRRSAVDARSPVQIAGEESGQTLDLGLQTTFMARVKSKSAKYSAICGNGPRGETKDAFCQVWKNTHACSKRMLELGMSLMAYARNTSWEQFGVRGGLEATPSGED